MCVGGGARSYSYSLFIPYSGRCGYIHVVHCLSVVVEEMEISYEVVFKYLQYREYPEEATENIKRAIRNKSKKFILKDGVLFYSCNGKLKQWINDKQQRKSVVESCHADKLGGHLGRDKTREKVTAR